MHNPSPDHRRKPIRLKGYDYHIPGAYFITICTHNRQCLFGNVVNGQMKLNEYGQIVQVTWDDLPHHNSCIELDEFVVMSGDFHAIIIAGAGFKPALK